MQLDWNTLTKSDGMPPSVPTRRTIEVEEKYKQHKLHLQDRGISISDYILGSILKGRKYAFCANTFNYWLEDGIEHHLLWMHPQHELSIDEARSLVRDLLDSSGQIDKQIVMFMNAAEKRSVQGVPHFQVFIK
jgi:hypothetical protein